MIKLVISYYYGDEFEGSNTNVPIWYESAEAFIVDLETHCNHVMASGNEYAPFIANGVEFEAYHFNAEYGNDGKFEFDAPEVEHWMNGLNRTHTK